MFQINVDTAEEDGLTIITAFRDQRQVKRHHRCVVADRPQTPGQGVVAQTRAAVEAACAGDDLSDAQGLGFKGSGVHGSRFNGSEAHNRWPLLSVIRRSRHLTITSHDSAEH